MNYSKLITDKVENSRCPSCGDKVFIPKEGFQKDNGGTEEDPIVFCHEMGHWVGKLSECKIKEKQYNAF
jgi:hypothetical protein